MHHRYNNIGNLCWHHGRVYSMVKYLLIESTAVKPTVSLRIAIFSSLLIVPLLAIVHCWCELMKIEKGYLLGSDPLLNQNLVNSMRP